MNIRRFFKFLLKFPLLKIQLLIKVTHRQTDTQNFDSNFFTFFNKNIIFSNLKMSLLFKAQPLFQLLPLPLIPRSQIKFRNH